MKFEIRVASGNYDKYDYILRKYGFDYDVDPYYGKFFTVIFNTIEDLVKFSEEIECSLIVHGMERVIYIYDDYME